MQKNPKNEVLGIKMTIFVRTPFEAEMLRFSYQNQKNSKYALNSNEKWLIMIGNN